MGTSPRKHHNFHDKEKVRQTDSSAPACLVSNYLVSFSQMESVKKKDRVFQILCPCCQSLLWVDSVTQEVVQSEKGAGKKKKSLDDLLMKEKKRKSEFDRKFEATAELEKKKKEKIEEGFKKALTQIEKED